MDLTEFRTLAESATPGHWTVYPQPVANAAEAKAELSALVDGTPETGATLYMLSAPNGLAPAITGIGKDSAANAVFIAACSPTNILALLNYVAELEVRLADYTGMYEPFKAMVDDVTEPAPQPPCENAYVAEGCELFEDAAPAPTAPSDTQDAARYRKLRDLIVNRANGKREAEWSAFLAAGLAFDDDQLDAALDSVPLSKS